MFTNARNAMAAAVAMAAIAAAGAAQAATVDISVQTFSLAAFNAHKAGLGSSVTETFEQPQGTAASQLSGGFNSALVGQFTTLGGDGGGGSVIGDGTDLALRNAPNFGRVNTTDGGKWFLDSNDTFGVKWDVSTGGLFDSVAFSLSDAADAGAKLTITADGGFLQSFVGQGNGIVDFIVISFSQKVSGATIALANTAGNGRPKINDGFGIDDATVGVSPVPLPPAAALLVAGLAALGWKGRRRRSA